LSFTSALVEFHLKASYVAPPPGYEEKYASDGGAGSEIPRLTIPTSDASYSLEASVKILSDLLTSLESISLREFTLLQGAVGAEVGFVTLPVSDAGYPVEASVKVVSDLLSSFDWVPYRMFIQPEGGYGTDALVFLKILAKDFFRAFEEAYGAEQMGKEAYDAVSAEAEKYIRSVSLNQKIYASDIVGLRDALYSLASYLASINFDLPNISLALRALEGIKPLTFDIVDCRHRNAISYALYYMHRAVRRRRYHSHDLGSGLDVSVLKNYTPVLMNLRVYNRGRGYSIYMTEENVRQNWCPGSANGWPPEKCQGFMAGWDYVYWIEDIKPVSQGDQDFEDIVLRVRLIGNILTVNAWHGEHGDTLDVYYGNTLLGTANPRSATKYDLAEVFTVNVNVDTGRIV